jgi:protein-S-isoprenylcysteine O-methyltransferase Ste14
MTQAVYLFGYVTLMIELVFFHVPSVANTQNFFVKNNNFNTTQNELIVRIYHWSFTKKILFLVFPMILVLLYFLLPFFFFLTSTHSKLVLLFVPNDVCNWIGIVFVFLGRLLTFGSMLYIRKENKQTGNSFKLHTKGIFRLTRNPGLDGMYLFFAGFCFLFPSLLMWLGLIFYFYYMLFRVKIEEAFLYQLYKEPFAIYKRTTNRFLLFK